MTATERSLFASSGRSARSFFRRTTAERAALLEQLCGDDAAVRGRVEAMLVADHNAYHIGQLMLLRRIVENS